MHGIFRMMVLILIDKKALYYAYLNNFRTIFIFQRKKGHLTKLDNKAYSPKRIVLFECVLIHNGMFSTKLELIYLT